MIIVDVLAIVTTIGACAIGTFLASGGFLKAVNRLEEYRNLFFYRVLIPPLRPISHLVIVCMIDIHSFLIRILGTIINEHFCHGLIVYGKLEVVVNMGI